MGVRILKTAKLKIYSCSAPLVDARTHDVRGTCSDNLSISGRGIKTKRRGLSHVGLQIGLIWGRSFDHFSVGKANVSMLLLGLIFWMGNP